MEKACVVLPPSGFDSVSVTPTGDVPLIAGAEAVNDSVPKTGLYVTAPNVSSDEPETTFVAEESPVPLMVIVAAVAPANTDAAGETFVTAGAAPIFSPTVVPFPYVYVPPVVFVTVR